MDNDTPKAGHEPAEPATSRNFHHDALESRFPRIDWEDAFATDFGPPDWILGKVSERSQQITLNGDGKVGKSLFLLDLLQRAVRGLPFLGDEARKPITVLYLDRENNLRDIVTGLRSLGVTDDDLKPLMERFIYMRFPSFTGMLDGPEAADELTLLLDWLASQDKQVDLVVLDTASRFIGGKENDADTWLSLYRYVHARLKARGIAGWRLDHFGKDQDRGARGSSAKSQDVDHVWELVKTGEQETHDNGATTVTTELRLTRSHTRTGVGPGVVHITRSGTKQGDVWTPGGSQHVLTDPDRVVKDTDVVNRTVEALLKAGAPLLGRTKLRDWAMAHGIPFPGDNSVANEVTRQFKARHPNNLPF